MTADTEEKEAKEVKVPKFEDFLPLSEARKEVEGMNLKSEVIDVSKLEVHASEDVGIVLRVNGATLIPSKPALTGLRQNCGVDYRGFRDYWENASLVSGMINHSLKKRSGQSIRVVHDSQYISQIESPDSMYMDPVKLFGIVEKQCPDVRVNFIKQNQHDGSVTMNFVHSKAGNPVRHVEDVSHCGFRISSHRRIQVTPYLYRLVCTNGMLSEADYPAATFLSPEEYEVGVEQLIRSKIDRSMEFLDWFVKSDETVVDNPAQLLIKLTKEHRVAARQTRIILDAQASLPAQATQYDVLNLVTNLANEHNNESFQWIGGKMLKSISDSRCVKCSSVLN